MLAAQPIMPKVMRRTTRRNVAVLGLLLAVAASPLYLGVETKQALAQPAQPYPQCTKTVTPQESDLAHQKYIAGKQDYDEGNYESALRRFRDAYNLDCQKHELLIIISAAYERNLDKKEAIAALEAYVLRAPTAPDAETYRTKIANLKKELAKAPPPSASSTSAPPPPPPASDNQEHTVFPWLVVGLGGAAAISGVIAIALAPDLPAGCDKTTEQCVYLDPNVADVPQGTQQRPTPAQKEDLTDRQATAGRAVTMPVVGYVLLASGGALIVGGLLWHFLEPTGPRESAPTSGRLRFKPSPAVAPGFAGLTFGGTF